MTISLYFTGSKYHMYKAEVKKVIGHFDLKWNYGRSGWYGELSSVKGEFEGSRRPVRLVIRDSIGDIGEGNSPSLEKVMVKLAEVIGVEVEELSGEDDVIVRSYYVVNRDHYVNRQYEELIERGCDKEKAKRLNGAYGEAFDKVFKQR